MLMFDNIDWCDVDSGDEFCIPDLPPLPPIKSLSFQSAVIEKEEQQPLTSVTQSETSEQTSSAAGYSQGSTEKERIKKISNGFVHRKRAKKGTKMPKYVCFVGKFPQQTTAAEMKQFVRSNGINFTKVRLGPKRKRNAFTFGYVELPSKKDYSKLMGLNGAVYRGRMVRIDRATPKGHSQKGKKEQTQKVNKTTRNQQSVYQPKQIDEHHTVLWLLKASSNNVNEKNKWTPRKSGARVKHGGCGKVTSRSQKYRNHMYSHFGGFRNHNKRYRSPTASTKSSKSCSRLQESSGQKNMDI